jgi:glycerol uptake facilitator-like aquaporin
MSRLLAEMLGTFALVFVGTGAIVINDITHGTVSHVGISLTFGLVVLTMVYAIGDISGAHLNPAVTLGFWAARRFNKVDVLPYILSQCAGAIVASLALHFLFQDHRTLGATQPSGPVVQSLALESILTFLLMFVILSVSTVSMNFSNLWVYVVGTSVGALVAVPAFERMRKDSSHSE